MKKFISFFTLSLCFLFIAMGVNAQNVNVNPGAGSYPTLKAAFDAINAGTHTGAVTVDIVLSTTEPVRATLNASGSGAASYTSVVVTTSVGGVTVSGSDSVTIKLAGADNVTIDGRVGGVGRNITVSNTNLLTGSSAIWISHGGVSTDSAGAQNNVIRNLEISCGASQSTLTTVTNGIIASGHNRLIGGRHNDNNQILENRVIKCRFGINLMGGVATSRSINNTIGGNIIGPASFGVNQIGQNGILVAFQTNCVITKNDVGFVGGTLATGSPGGADRVGIAVGTGAWSNTTTTTTTNSNITVSQNIVHDIVEEQTFSSVGILIGTTLSGPKTNNLIVNNVIYNVRGNGTSGDQAAGIGHAGGPGDRIVFNSISISGDLDPAGTTSASTNPVIAGISKHLAAAADTTVLIKDNAISVDATTNTGTLLKVAIIGPATGYAFGTGGLDYNDYWIPTPGVGGQVTGVTGTGTLSFTTLAAWKLAYTPNQDANSIQCDPLFSVNLQPAVGSCVFSAGTPIAGVIDDIVKTARNVTNPTIGAWETGIVPPNEVGITATNIANGRVYSTGKCYDFTATVKNFGPALAPGIPVYYKVDGGSPIGPVNTATPLATGATEVVTFTGGLALCGLSAGLHNIDVYTDLQPAPPAINRPPLNTVIGVADKIAAFPYLQTFTNPVNWTIIFENIVGTTQLWGLGICRNPDGKSPDTAATSNCFNGSAGRIEVLRSPEMDFTSLSNPVLDFYVAYRSFTGGENDSMDVVISTNGGLAFFSASTVYQKSAETVPSLATRPGQGTSFFPDSSIQWRHETISLANVSGNSNVIIGFRSISDFGNRQWVDNVIVRNADGLCTDAVSGPGTYNCNGKVSLDFITTPVPHANFAGLDGRSSAQKTIEKSGSDLPVIPSQGATVTTIPSERDNSSVPATAFVTEYDNTDPGFNIATNSTATAPDGTIFTPSTVYQDYWFTVTYTGNDLAGYATYDISIDLTTLAFTNPDALYIVKRTDMTGAWTCQNTTRSGNILKASGLTIFSDFGIAGNDALPVELATFVASTNANSVTLNWTTTMETNNAGFDIERSSANGSWSKVGNVAGNGTTTSSHSYSYTDRNVATGNYSYRLKQTDFNGNFEYYNLSNEVIVGIPTKYELSQNYPNPFNPSTSINYEIPFDGKVSLKIFDMSGKEVATLVNEVKTAGYYSYNFNASSLSSGVYFYSLSANNFTATKKMLLVK